MREVDHRARNALSAVQSVLQLTRADDIVGYRDAVMRRVTARARAGFGPVHVLDPFCASGEPTSALNPLAPRDPATLDIAEDAAPIAKALVYDPPAKWTKRIGTKKQRRWSGIVSTIVIKRMGRLSRVFRG